jgi:hypothetical protein
MPSERSVLAQNVDHRKDLPAATLIQLPGQKP